MMMLMMVLVVLVAVIQVHEKKHWTSWYTYQHLSWQSVSTCISQVALHPRMQLNWRPLTCTDSNGCDSFPTNLTQTRVHFLDVVVTK